MRGRLRHLRVRDLEKMIALGEPSPGIVIVPAARDGGTNALLLHPANAIGFHFGDKSFDKHVADAQTNNIPVSTYNSDTVTFDLDLPEDLALSKGLSF